MKRMVLILLTLVLMNTFAFAQSETTIVPIIEINTSVPTATPQPAGEVFSCETLIITLPEGFSTLEEAETAGYIAAVEDAYSLDAHFLFAAQNKDGAAICMAVIDDETPALEACRDAAKNILGSKDNAAEYTYGENTYAGFACALDESVFQIYYISNGTQLVMISTADVSAEDTAALLESMVF